MNLTIVDFQPLVGETFDIPHHESGEVYTRLALREVSPIGKPHAGRAEPFSLKFEGPRVTPLNQNTYLLRHQTLGDNYIFIVPIAESGDIREYEAIFN